MIHRHSTWSFHVLTTILAILSLDGNRQSCQVSAFVGSNKNNDRLNFKNNHAQNQHKSSIGKDSTKIAFLPTAKSSPSSLHLMVEDGGMMMINDIIMNGNSLLLSTVSADIDNIPSNEFATVFAGGIAVMIGGVASALIVGGILETGDSYASVVADSYEEQKEEMLRNIQDEDEEFWSKLSPEETEQAKQILITLKEKKMEREGKKVPTSQTPISKEVPEKSTTTSSESNMFSDYDD